MITGELKHRIDGLWDICAAGGLVNPLDVIEQITYLMFIRELDTAAPGSPQEGIFAGKSMRLRWRTLRKMPAEEMFAAVRDEVFPFIRALGPDGGAYARYMDDAIFKLPTPQLLCRMADALDALPERADIRGDIYEYLLLKLAQSGRNGQFRTPRHIIRMIVEMMAPQADDSICDPACGTAGFLVAAAEYLAGAGVPLGGRGRMFCGYDIDRTMLRISAMNMMAHGIAQPDIEYRNSLSDGGRDGGRFSLILANPPFKGALNGDEVGAELLEACPTKRSELLFLALFLRMLRVGGRCACIVPEGVLFGTSKAHRMVRRMLVADNRLDAVIAMPAGVFRPYAAVRTAVLIFAKTECGGTQDVWFYDMQADGFSLDDRRVPCAANDIPDILARFRDREGEKRRQRSEQSFLVPADEIARNGYDLSVGRYRREMRESEPMPSAAEILAEMQAREERIRAGLQEICALLEKE